MSKSQQIIKNNNNTINIDKFSTNKGEFISVTPELLKDKKLTTYNEFVENEKTTNTK